MADYVRYWSERTGIRYRRIVRWIGIPRSKFYQWQQRYGRVNEHNAWIPRDFWLRDGEKQAIRDFWSTHSREGYRRMTYMMLDADTVAVSPRTVYRVLQDAGVLHRWNRNHTSSKGQGFQRAVKPHEHWHIDISYINLQGTFYYPCSVLDGYSRYLVAWDLRESMTEPHVEIVLQRARERFPEARPRIISDNGPQFIAKDFKQFIRLSGMSHVRTSPYYPQSNGKLERWQQSAKTECIRPKTPQSRRNGTVLVWRPTSSRIVLSVAIPAMEPRLSFCLSTEVTRRVGGTIINYIDYTAARPSVGTSPAGGLPLNLPILLPSVRKESSKRNDGSCR